MRRYASKPFIKVQIATKVSTNDDECNWNIQKIAAVATPNKLNVDFIQLYVLWANQILYKSVLIIAQFQLSTFTFQIV